MTESRQALPTPRSLYARMLFATAHGMTLVGGAILLAMIVMVVASIVGRALFNAPVYGDFELVAMGTAASVTLFLPYCQLVRGNVIVDLLLARAPERVKLACDVLGGLLYAGIAGVLTVRSLYGGLDLYRYNETSMILSIPVWWVFPFLVLSLAVLCLCCLYTAAADLRRMVE